MRKNILLVAITALAITAFFAVPNALRAQSAIALTGTVTSAAEGPMEGVLVSAKQSGSTVTVTVVSDQQGRYRFPASKLQPGQYALAVRAVGYELESPKSVTVSPGATAADLKLAKVTDISGQLSDAEWLASMPGTDAQKKQFLDCAGCHSIQRAVMSRYTADELVPVLIRMRSAYVNNSTPLFPQRRAKATPPSPEQVRGFAEYIASINLSQGPWKYPLKTFPRPKGQATHVVITEYDLPRRAIEPHDVTVDKAGMVWFSDFGEQVLGMLDPKTAKVTEYQVPTIKQGAPNGMLDLEWDKNGNIWLANMFQGGIQQFNPQTKQFKTWALPAPWQGDESQQTFLTPPGPDGKMWVKDNGTQHIFKFDPVAGTWQPYGPAKDSTHQFDTYQIWADSHNNVYAADFTGCCGGNIAKWDTNTGALTIYPTPTQVSRPRRGRLDAQERLWFAEYAANRVAMLDPKTGKITEWEMATPWTSPYDVVTDKSGVLWTGSMWTDRITRLDPKTGKMIEYLLPRETNIRRVFVDNSTTPVTFWVGNNHQAKVTKLEPLD